MRIRKRTAHGRVRARTLRRETKRKIRNGDTQDLTRLKNKSKLRVVCNSKKTYFSRESTIKALATIKFRAETGTFEDFCQAKRGYFCDIHGGWHLTKTDLRRNPVRSDVLPGDY